MVVPLKGLKNWVLEKPLQYITESFGSKPVNFSLEPVYFPTLHYHF